MTERKKSTKGRGARKASPERPRDLEVRDEAGPTGGDWSWMKSTQVWDASRKIFVYPENWLQP